MAAVRGRLRRRYGGSPLLEWRRRAGERARLRRLGRAAVQLLLAASLARAWRAWRAAVRVRCLDSRLAACCCHQSTHRPAAIARQPTCRQGSMAVRAPNWSWP